MELVKNVIGVIFSLVIALGAIWLFLYGLLGTQRFVKYMEWCHQDPSLFEMLILGPVAVAIGLGAAYLWWQVVLLVAVWLGLVKPDPLHNKFPFIRH